MDFDLFINIHLFCKARNMPITTFGRLAVNDCTLVTDLKRGRMPKPETKARIIAFMEAA